MSDEEDRAIKNRKNEARNKGKTNGNYERLEDNEEAIT